MLPSYRFANQLSPGIAIFADLAGVPINKGIPWFKFNLPGAGDLTFLIACPSKYSQPNRFPAIIFPAFISCEDFSEISRYLPIRTLIHADQPHFDLSNSIIVQP